jgi:hypothetical protein
MGFGTAACSFSTTVTGAVEGSVLCCWNFVWVWARHVCAAVHADGEMQLTVWPNEVRRERERVCVCVCVCVCGGGGLRTKPGARL